MTAKAKIAASGVALLIAGLAAVQTARAYSLEGPVWTGKKATIDYTVAGQPNATFSAALFKSLVIWNQKSAFKWAAFKKTANPCASSGPVGVSLGNAACGEAFGSGVLGITMYSFTSGTSSSMPARCSTRGRISASMTVR